MTGDVVPGIPQKRFNASYLNYCTNRDTTKDYGAPEENAAKLQRLKIWLGSLIGLAGAFFIVAQMV